MPEDWKWTQIANHDTLTEGPVWDGSALLYNECYANTTFRWDPKTGESSVWRTNTGQANGMTFDRQGQLDVATAAYIDPSRRELEAKEIIQIARDLASYAKSPD